MATSAGGPVSNITDLSWASEPEHKDDALCLAFYPPATVVSGGANGDVLVWELDTSALTVRTSSSSAAALPHPTHTLHLSLQVLLTTSYTSAEEVSKYVPEAHMPNHLKEGRPDGPDEAP